MEVRILLAVDFLFLRQSLTLLLLEEGYDVMSVESGAEALACRPDAVDLVVTDEFLSDMPGRVLIEEVRSRVRGACVPCVFLLDSGCSPQKRTRRTVPSSASVGTPFRFDALRDSIRSLLQQTRVAS